MYTLQMETLSSRLLRNAERTGIGVEQGSARPCPLTRQAVLPGNKRPLRSRMERQKYHKIQRTAVKGAPRDDQGKDGDELLLPEEDWTVPGGYQDSMSKNTKLGRALDDACKELDTLGDLERESLVEASDLLKKLGYKGDITAPRIPPKVTEEGQE